MNHITLVKKGIAMRSAQKEYEKKETAGTWKNGRERTEAYAALMLLEKNFDILLAEAVSAPLPQLKLPI